MNRKRQKPITHLDKGLESKRKLFEAAKEEFYEFGYKNAKIQHIVDRVDVPLGLFSIISAQKRLLSKKSARNTSKQFISICFKMIGLRMTLRCSGIFLRQKFITKIFYQTKISYDFIMKFWHANPIIALCIAASSTYMAQSAGNTV
jgi:hypothetical protein